MQCLFSIISFVSIISFISGGIVKVCNGMCFPRVVWNHWDDNLVPEDVKEMINVTRKSLQNFTFILLTPSNFSEFLEVGSFPENYHNLHRAGKGDYVRICLLKKYGGIYIDATTYVTSGSEIEWFFSRGVSSKSQAFGFSYGEDFELLLSTNFFGVCESSLLMKKFEEEFDFSLEKSVFEKYPEEACKELLAHHVVVPDTYICRDENYYRIFIIYFKITHDNEALKRSVLLLPRSLNRDHEVVIRECKYETKDVITHLFYPLGKCVKNRLLHDPVARTTPFIKVWHYFRDGKRFHIGDTEYDPGLFQNIDYEGEIKFIEKRNASFRILKKSALLTLFCLAVICSIVVSKKHRIRNSKKMN